MYTIRTDPNILPIQHVQCKVPIEYQEQIENMFDDMVTKGVIVPVSGPTEWVSLLTYPCKSDGSLHICLNPKDLGKAIVQEHYKAPTLDEISHCLCGATCFSKLNTKDGFWSINLDEKSTHIMAGTISCICPSVYRCPRTSFRCKWTRQQTIYLALLPYMMIYVYSAVPIV